ncbi:MAG: glycosyltransferase, partial [Candidatus Omnitrophica bacterium]|nr:glycosyltransferase [Candidatus Omnitrophota bacterium]
ADVKDYLKTQTLSGIAEVKAVDLGALTSIFKMPFKLAGKINGMENRQELPPFCDAVIPNYYDPEEFTYSQDKENYFLFVGRPIRKKGLEIAVKCVEEIGGQLKVAGQKDTILNPRVEYFGVVGSEERTRLMSKAKALFVPTCYLEPFGGVAVEAMMCGTPVISTDFGVFPETVVHGKTGFRCRTFEQFVWAAKNIHLIKPKDCREHAEKNYSIKRVGLMYEEYFEMLKRFSEGGWYQENPDRKELDWLNKFSL